MTPEQIDQFLAGRELDVAVAEKIMAWSNIFETNDLGQDFAGYPPEDQRKYHSEHFSHYVPHYSTEIAAAWLVVEKLQSEGKRVILSNGKVSTSELSWAAGFYYISQLPIQHLKPIADGFRGESETAALAICRAALKTVMGEKE